MKLLNRNARVGLPGIVFFEPTQEFIDFVKRTAPNGFIVDVGAGTGLMSKELSKHGIKSLAIDLLPRDNPVYKVFEMDATQFTFPPNALPIMARPCHGYWVDPTIKNALTSAPLFVYVGLDKNYDTDLGFLEDEGYQIKRLDFVAGKDGEHVWEIRNQ